MLIRSARPRCLPSEVESNLDIRSLSSSAVEESLWRKAEVGKREAADDEEEDDEEEEEQDAEVEMEGVTDFKTLFLFDSSPEIVLCLIRWQT